MAGDLTLRITVTEIETLQKNRLHVAGECGRRGRCGHQHFVAAVDQVPRAGLMKRVCELVVDVPAIMYEQSVESRSQQTGSFLVAAAAQDAVDRRVAGDRDPQPPGVSSHFPARFVHGHAGTHPDLADELLVGRFALFSQARQSLAQPAGCQGPATSLEKAWSRTAVVLPRGIPSSLFRMVASDRASGPTCEAAAPRASEVWRESRPWILLPHFAQLPTWI